MIVWNEALCNFIQTHLNEDPDDLILKASRYKGIDVAFAAAQIAARNRIRYKLPQWYANDQLIFPSRLSTEQCSSQATALYKQQLVDEQESIADLTGGLGVDSYYFSQKVRNVLYVERFREYCEAAIHNFKALHAGNIEVECDDSMSIVQDLQADVFYVDPARRAANDKRVYALTDCEPDLTQCLPMFLSRAKRVIAKLSPMADISETLRLLPGTCEIHVLSVRNECKELLFVIRDVPCDDPQVVCVNFFADGSSQSFSFHLSEEKKAAVSFAPSMLSYLYEPSASVLKAGAFKILCERFAIQKIAPNSHLYTSAELLPDFPGRRFAVDELIPFNRQCRSIMQRIPQANIAVRNFPLSVDDLRKRTRIADGGEVYLFATTLGDGQKCLIRCSKV